MGFRQSKLRKRKYPTGKHHPRWLGGERKKKACQFCGVRFGLNPTESIKTFWKRKFCTKVCADKGGLRYRGEDHPLYRAESRRKNRGGSHHKWVNAVLSRDKATCQKCGAKGIELHAHHIKSYRDHPELRFDLNNGLTLCFRCHWETHTALDAKAVNSVNTRQGNTEPSSRGNPLEGVTTRGRAYRRWVGPCDWCGSVISKRWSDTTSKIALFCNKKCMGKWTANKRFGNPPKPTAVNSSTSPAPERDEIV